MFTGGNGTGKICDRRTKLPIWPINKDQRIQNPIIRPNIISILTHTHTSVIIAIRAHRRPCPPCPSTPAPPAPVLRRDEGRRLQ